MSEDDNPEDLEDQNQQEEQEDQGSTPTPQHSCGAALKKGMQYCPACGDPVDTSSYK